jgi:hypothetical protein
MTGLLGHSSVRCLHSGSVPWMDRITEGSVTVTEESSINEIGEAEHFIIHQSSPNMPLPRGRCIRGLPEVDQAGPLAPPFVLMF